MIKEMKYSKNIRTAAEAEKPKIKRTSSRIYTSTVEYGMIANLVKQQYEQNNKVRFEALLSIPLQDRIPGLMERYGKKTMHKLLLMILREFFFSLSMPKYKKPNETRISILACEVMLSSYEDYLSLEDVILFLQRAKSGQYGIIKDLVDTNKLLSSLEVYRQARHDIYLQLKGEKEAILKQAGPVEKSAAEPTQLSLLLKEANVIDMNRRMSG